MKFRFLKKYLADNSRSIFNKNERLATNIVKDIPTSRIDKRHRHLTTFNSGKLVPIMIEEALPGDIFNMNISTLLRLSTPQAATMESPIFDIATFFIPLRILWPEFKYFMGENKEAGFQKQYKTLPLVTYDTTLKYKENDLAAYLGFPINKDFSKIKLPINALAFKAYGKVWNDYYRDQNLQAEIDISNNNKNNENVIVSEYKGKPYNVSIQIGQGLAPVSRLNDYFSTCLPWPQKGEAVTIETLPLQNLYIKNLEYDNDTKLSPKWTNANGSPYGPLPIGTTPGGTQGFKNTSGTGTGDLAYINLGVDIKSGSTLYSINDLRLSIALQHMRELDARGGTRYIEYLLNHFGVKSSDSRLDRAEYIGGFRDNVQINNIVQSSNGTDISPLGSIGGVSVTGAQSPNAINYAVEEHGFIMSFIVIRPQVNYSQGLNKLFIKSEKLDYYDPLLANIGEQPILKHEIYLDDSDGSNTNNDIFGYNEAWADLRYSHNKMSGYMSANSDLSLCTLYAYTEKYETAPTLSASWMEAKSSVIGDTLKMNSETLEFANQFLADFYFDLYVERRIPLFSIPGIRKI